MSNSNRSAREELERIYGKHCFICEGIRSLNPPKPHKCLYKGKSIAEQLTYHHIIPKRLGGQATIENGAEICRSCHDWLEQLSSTEREQINEELKEYKRKLSQECDVEYVERLEKDYVIAGYIFTPDKLRDPYNRAKDKKKYEKIINEEEER